MIEITNVSKTYSGSVKAVDDLTMTVRDGEIFGFLGPNGAGKTTTLKIISGILNADSGNVKINGWDIKTDPLDAKKQFGFVPDDPNMFLKLKGIEYLNFMADIYEVPPDTRKERIKDLSVRFEMANSLGDQIQSYSHGMRQKIVVMGVLVHNPSVWILDEPLTGLDPRSSFLLKEMMNDHKDQGNTVLFSTHVLDVAEKICDRIGIINRGKLLFCGDLKEMRDRFKRDESLENMFLELTGNED